MPSIYAAVCDDQDRYLIARKRVTNRWWGSVVAPQATIVNQAGQWALPGGGLEANESPEVGALREFREETAIDLTTYHPNLDFSLVEIQQGEACYYLVRFVVAAVQLDAIFQAASNNLVQDPNNALRPTGPIADWELDQVQIVQRPALWTHLGVRQATLPMYDAQVYQNPQAPPAQRVLRNSQRIDWFRWVAVQIMNAPAPAAQALMEQ